MDTDCTGYGSPVNVYLVRHGETGWSLTGQHTSRTEFALTPRGQAQARSLGPTLSAVHFDRVLTSPLQRARETCVLAGLGSAAEIELDLTEWDYGEFEGRRSQDICRDWPGWSCYHDGCPGGESPGDICRRADRMVAKLRTFGGNVAIFTHGQFGCSLAARWIGLSVPQGEHLQLGTASISILAFNPSRPWLPVIAQWNVSPGLGTDAEHDRSVPAKSGEQFRA